LSGCSGIDGFVSLPPGRTLRCSSLFLAATLGLSSLAVAAEPVAPARRIGIVTEAWSANHPIVLGFKAGLRDLGFEEGRDVTFDIRHTDGNRAATTTAAAALVRSDADLVFACDVNSARAAKAATAKLPIVFAQVEDPVAAGLVYELARPGGNVTGVSSLANELAPKRIEVLKKLQPALRRVWLVHAPDDPSAVAALARLREVGPRLGVTIVSQAVGAAADLVTSQRNLRPGDALMTPDDAAPDISVDVLKLSLQARVPAVFASSLWVGYGGLASYGPDSFAQGMQAARLAAKVLLGAQPGRLPVESADAIDLAVNLRTAGLMNINVPRKILLRANTIRR